MTEQNQITYYDTEVVCRYLNDISNEGTAWVPSVTKKKITVEVDGEKKELQTIVQIVLTVAPGLATKMWTPKEESEETSGDAITSGDTVSDAPCDGNVVDASCDAHAEQIVVAEETETNAA